MLYFDLNLPRDINLIKLHNCQNAPSADIAGIKPSMTNLITLCKIAL